MTKSILVKLSGPLGQMVELGTGLTGLGFESHWCLSCWLPVFMCACLSPVSDFFCEGL